MTRHFEGLERYADLLEKIDAWEGGQADSVARWVMAHLKPRSVVDIGCASGLYLRLFMEAGIEVLGVDGAPMAGQKLPPEKYLRFDLRNPLFLPRIFDVCLCLETAEHIEQEYTDIFVRSVASSAYTLVFSAAQPGQGGEGHFNEQPVSYWLEKFAAYGFSIHPKNDDFQILIHENEGPTSYFHPWLIHNSVILHKSTKNGDAKWMSATSVSIAEMSMIDGPATTGESSNAPAAERTSFIKKVTTLLHRGY